MAVDTNKTSFGFRTIFATADTDAIRIRHCSYRGTVGRHVDPSTNLFVFKILNQINKL